MVRLLESRNPERARHRPQKWCTDCAIQLDPLGPVPPLTSLNIRLPLTLHSPLLSLKDHRYTHFNNNRKALEYGAGTLAAGQLFRYDIGLIRQEKAMVESTVNRIKLAREVLQAAREEFSRAEEAKGGAAVISGSGIPAGRAGWPP